MERLLHYVWKYKLYAEAILTTTDGIPLSVIDPGIENTNAGPDFFNAKLIIGETLWAGCVEIHDKASDWFVHRHDKDRAYDTVVLHVVGADDAQICRPNGEVVPQTVLSVPPSLLQNIDWLLQRDAPIPCIDCIRDIEPVHLSAWLDTLLGERLERKATDILSWLDQYEEDWNEVFYILLTRHFGLGMNNDAFEWLARSLPLRFIQRQRGNPAQVEALLFGQAGMLQEEGDCPYYALLQREYQFLSHKFGLKPLDASLFKNLRIRPASIPPLKIAQLAAIWQQCDTLFSVLLQAKSADEIKAHLRVQPSAYWQTHYHFRYASVPKEKPMGENMLNVLLINVVVPMFLAYGLRNHLPDYTGRAIRLLESMPPESNSIITTFRHAGIPVNTACRSQALIQLKRAYCEPKKCMYCRIGFRLLKRSTMPATEPPTSGKK